MRYYASTLPPVDFSFNLLMSEEEIENKLEEGYEDEKDLTDPHALKSASRILFPKLGIDVDIDKGGFFIVPNKSGIYFDLFYFVKGSNNGTCYICGKEKFPYGDDFIEGDI